MGFLKIEFSAVFSQERRVRGLTGTRAAMAECSIEHPAKTGKPDSSQKIQEGNTTT
jgi:hypothetical protein